MNKKLFVTLFTIVLLSFLLASGCALKKGEETLTQSEKPETLLVYSGAGLRKAMDSIGQAFEEKYNVKVEYSYAGSAQNLSQIELTGKGDAWIPGSSYYCDTAEEKGLIESRQDVAYHIPVIVVPKGNPASIYSIEDMARPGVNVVLGDEKACAIGKVAAKIFEEEELFVSIDSNIKAKTATVTDLVVYMKMKQADASIIWEDNMVGIDEVEIIQIPEEINQIKTIPVAVLRTSEKKELAQKFADFVASKEGKNLFKQNGFRPVE